MNYPQGTISMADEAYRRIEDMIVMRLLPPGAMLSEKTLADELGCGRTPIREALLRLKLEGYIDIHSRRGAMVCAVDVVKQLDLLEVRRPLEETMAMLAAERATTLERKRVRELADEILAAAGSDEIGAYFRVNKAIHQTCASLTKNETLQKTMGVVHGLSRRFWYTYIEDGRRHEAAKLHAAMLRSIASGDALGAASDSRDLMNFLEGLTRAAIDRQI